MLEILQKILVLIKQSVSKQSFVYRFYMLNGTEGNKQIKIGNSIEYTFINSGSTVVIINNQFLIYPSYMGNFPNERKFVCNRYETDETVYKYDFRPVNSIPEILDPITGNATKPIPQFDKLGKEEDNVNRLQVIVKERVSKDNILRKGD